MLFAGGFKADEEMSCWMIRVEVFLRFRGSGAYNCSDAKVVILMV